MIQILTKAAIEKPTQVQYESLLDDFWEFCDLFSRDSLPPSRRKVQEYICFLCFYKHVKQGAADKRITALGNFWLSNGYDWNRKQYPTINILMRGYKKLNPSDIRIKNPFTIIHMRKAFQWINLNTYNGLLLGSTFCIGYFFGGRVGECSPKSRDQWSEVIRPKDLTFIGQQSNLKSLIMDFRQHKTNKFGYYSGKVESICSCKCGICLVHIIAKFLKFREKEYGPAINNPLLLRLDERPLPPTHVNHAIKNMVIKMGLDPTKYSSHSFRSGRATDLARALKPSWFIKK